MLKFKSLELLYYIVEEEWIDYYLKDKKGNIKIYREFN